MGGIDGGNIFKHQIYSSGSAFKPARKLTNADRIRAMSDEELAEFILGGQPDFCHLGMCDDGETCEGCCLNWLRKEHK